MRTRRRCSTSGRPPAQRPTDERPISEWTVEEIDRFFNELVMLVVYDGPAQ